MVNRKQIYILDELKKLLEASSCIILVSDLRLNGFLSDIEVILIKHASSDADRISTLFELLKQKPDDCFLEIQKTAYSNSWSDIKDYVSRELEKCGLHHLVYPTSVTVQTASCSTTTTLVARVTKKLTVKEIRHLLNEIFLHCDLNPDHYVDSLFVNRVITSFHKADIAKETYRIGKQTMLAEGISAKGMNGVKKFRDIAVGNDDDLLVAQLDKTFVF